MKKKLLIIALIAIIGFSLAACGNLDDNIKSSSNGYGDGDNSNDHWLIYSQQAYTVKDGIASYSSWINYNWITYRYTNETNYEEEYTTLSSSSSSSFSQYHYIRNGQTSNSTTDTETLYGSGTSSNFSTTTTYDSESGLIASQTTVSSEGVTTEIIYSIKQLSNADGVKTYEYYPVGNSGYYIYKIQNGKTLEISYYDTNSVLIYTTTYFQPDNAEIRRKLPNFRLSRTIYNSSSYSINNSYQMAEVLSLNEKFGIIGIIRREDEYLDFKIRVKTFNNDGVLSSQIDYHYINDNAYSYINVWIKGKEEHFRINSGFIYYTDYDEGEIIVISGYIGGAGGDITIPAKIDGKPVTIIGFDFGNRLFVPGSAGYIIPNNGNITSVTIPNSVKQIGYYFYDSELSVASPFSGHAKLTAINVDASNPVYSSQEGVLYDKNKTTLFRCPEGKTSTFTIPNSVTSIGHEAFRGCYKLTSITIPNSVTRIGYQAFKDCYNLTSLTIGSGVTSIGYQAFLNCYKLTSVTIPNSVTSIEDEAFWDCTNLTSVEFEGIITEDNFGEDSFLGDLRDKYLAGGKGTYTTTNPRSNPIWIKQQ